MICNTAPIDLQKAMTKKSPLLTLLGHLFSPISSYALIEALLSDTVPDRSALVHSIARC